MIAFTDHAALTATDSRAAIHDEHLANQAEISLRNRGYSSLTKLRCDANGGEVTIHGVVPSYYMKQLAQELVLRLEGVREVCNSVTVQWT